MKGARTYALLIAALVLLFVVLAFAVVEIAGFSLSLVSYLIMGLVVVLGTFLVVRRIFIRFVETRIDPIYKTIQNHNTSRKSIREKIDRGHVIDDLNKEVEVWAQSQSEEIKKLKKLEKYRKDFLGNVSHELKTPIFNIQGYILTLLEGGIEDPAINKLYLKRAEQHIKIGFDKNYPKAVQVKADRKRIMEVVLNLISNAIKYGREGGKTTIGFTDTGKKILVDVSDNGIGIEEKNLPRIFERFYRVDKSRSRESGGTGLGLAIVKHTLQAHGQTITVKSEVNKGSTFIFSLDRG